LARVNETTCSIWLGVYYFELVWYI
jgi:hypothetical protein